MDIIRAKEIVSALAEGIDPTTGEVLPGDSIYNKGDVVRALYAVLSELDQASRRKNNRQPINAGKPWNDIEDEHLKEEFNSGAKISEMAKEHGRTYGAIESRLDYLGLKKKPFWIFKSKKK